MSVYTSHMEDTTSIPTFYSHVDELGPRAAGRLLGFDHSAVSRALAGETDPTKLLLAALKQWPDIDLVATEVETVRRRAKYKALARCADIASGLADAQ